MNIQEVAKEQKKLLDELNDNPNKDTAKKLLEVVCVVTYLMKSDIHDYEDSIKHAMWQYLSKR